ncbi:lamin tail domain-containing protein [Akkermansiaceae bacterium]|nr:lamin tail domain-containing protein [Akkermansiaceae bacterium]
MIKTLLLFPALALPLSAQLRITEVMSNSNHSDTAANGDWFEITNTGSTAINVAGYSFDDDDRLAGASGGVSCLRAAVWSLDDCAERSFQHHFPLSMES